MPLSINVGLSRKASKDYQSTGVSSLARTLREQSPNQAAERITGRNYLSHSQISTMRSCPRKFAFLYVEKAAADFIPASLIFGGSIHAALELYFRARLEGLAVTQEALLSAYHDGWRQQRHKTGIEVPVQFGKDQSEDTLHLLADRIIASFLESPLASPEWLPPNRFCGHGRTSTVPHIPACPTCCRRPSAIGIGKAYTASAAHLGERSSTICELS